MKRGETGSAETHVESNPTQISAGEIRAKECARELAPKRPDANRVSVESGRAIAGSADQRGEHGSKIDLTVRSIATSAALGSGR